MAEKTTRWDIYFQPGQMIFHVPKDIQNDDRTLSDLHQWAKNVVEKEGKGAFKYVTISPPEVFTVKSVKRSDSSTYPRQRGKADDRPTVTDQQSKLPFLTWIFQFLKSIFQTAPQAKAPPTFSLVSFPVTSKGWPAFQAYEEDKNPEEQEKQKTAFIELFQLITLLDDRRGSAPIKLKAVTPNWLMSGSAPSSPGGTGGPGGEPSCATEAEATSRTFSSEQTFFLKIPDNPSATMETAEGVTVAILDTCYPDNKWVDLKTDWPAHPLITRLLGGPGGASGALHVHPDAKVDAYLPGVKIDGHDYDMTDHGLFIAGVINSLAPEAELHLYQVLNQYGLGDMLTIAHTLDTIIKKDFSDRLDKLFINMSLTLNLPLQDKHINKNKLGKNDEIGQKILKKKRDGEWFWNLVHWICRILQWILRWFIPGFVLSCRGSWADRQALAFEWINDLVHVLGPGVIAAAGNNGSGGHRPAALYPAAYDSVLGVAALSKDPNNPQKLIPASYSDLADTPTTQGIAVFGGEEGDGNGVPGVFVGPFPHGRSNTTGYAWWAGTSFATPMITGLAAALIINKKAVNARDAIKILLDHPSGSTGEFERIIPVEP